MCVVLLNCVGLCCFPFRDHHYLRSPQCAPPPTEERGDPAWLVAGAEFLSNAVPEAAPAFVKQALAPGTQLGPWFYAPLLTSVVAAPALDFLLGESSINRCGARCGVVWYSVVW